MLVKVAIKPILDNTDSIEEVLRDYVIQKEHYCNGILCTCVIQLDYASDLWDLQEKLGHGIRLLNGTNYDLLIEPQRNKQEENKI